MAEFKKDDRVKIVQGSKPFEGLKGIVLSTNLDEIKVKVNFSNDEDNLRKIVQIFKPEQLELIQTLNENNYKGDNNMLKLTVEELKHWCSANDANYYTQDIADDNTVVIRNLTEEIGIYNFETEELILNREDLIESKTETENDDFIHDYVFDVDSEGELYPSWEFIGKIAVAENVDEREIFEIAEKYGYKVFIVEGVNFYRVIVAAKKITEQNIYDDYADFLQGNIRIKEWK